MSDTSLTLEDYEMASNQDKLLQERATTLFLNAGLNVAVDIDNGVARLTGMVDSRREHQAAIDLIASFGEVTEIEDEIEIITTGPDSAFDDGSVEEGFEYVENPSWSEPGDDEAVAEFVPDFMDDSGAGARDVQEAVEEAEPYFPPTDPVVHPSDDDEGLEVIGGFQDTSMDELADEPALDRPEDDSPGAAARARDDETIREDVIRELREDAATTDLDVPVEVYRGIVVLRGVVPSLDDALNAEEVAGRVPGVLEVQDEMTIEPVG
jgi:osmotically-inducible protein OsmY